MFLDLKKALKFARENKFAIPAFNVFDLEGVLAISKAASELKALVIIQTTPKAIDYAGLNQIFNIIKNEIHTTDIKAAVNLDHARDFGTIRECIDIGYNSVMIDGSALDFESNVAVTKKVVRYASERKVNVEAEVGVIGREVSEIGREQKNLTDPKVAQKFVEQTGIDAVAVSVGNRHGAPKGEKLNLNLLESICQLVEIPIVLHGSSGLSHLDIKKAIDLGVAKINIDTKLRQAFLAEIKEIKDDQDDPRAVLEDATEAMSEIVKSYIKLVGAEGRADEI